MNEFVKTAIGKKLNKAILFAARRLQYSPNLVFVPKYDFEVFKANIPSYLEADFKISNNTEIYTIYNTKILAYNSLDEIHGFVKDRVKYLFAFEEGKFEGRHIDFEDWHLFYFEAVLSLTVEEESLLNERLLNLVDSYIFKKDDTEDLLKFLEKFKNPLVDIYIKNKLYRGCVDADKFLPVPTDNVCIDIRFTSKRKNAAFLYAQRAIVLTELKETFGNNYSYEDYIEESISIW